jgi:hypothetical protein
MSLVFDDSVRKDGDDPFDHCAYSGFDAAGDATSSERGSGARFNAGKPPMELIPYRALYPAAEVFGYGAKKYASWNWAKGMAWSIPLACMQRHLAAIQSGEMNDPESGLPHIGHVLCNALMLSHFMEFCPDMNDFPEQLTEAYHRDAD